MREDWLRPPAGLERVEGGHVTSPSGYRASGVACGLKESGQRDIGILVSDRPCVSAMVDTVNALPSAPVIHNRTLDRSRLRAVVVNSGNANASTGPTGVEGARSMAERTARLLGLHPGEVAVCSTGTIGERLDPVRVAAGIDAAAADLSEDGGWRFDEAIRTTDRVGKGGAFRIELSAGPVTIGAAAKGAGMIRPTMATMLAFLTLDVKVSVADLQRITAAAADASFNRISVDGQMSPSDTLLVFANGEGRALQGEDLERLEEAVTAVCRWLAVQMVKDGEGAEHAVRVLVTGASDAEEAERVARAIGESPLVKTAAFGRDPNWGRISQAVGQALAGRGGPEARLVVGFDGVPGDSPEVAEVLAREEYDLQVALGRGHAGAEVWFSDLTHAYVTLNAEYHT